MIPVRLQLQNFLSYGDEAPALDFEGIHVACLSGGNGQGKSALLDAMTWALWGEARKSSDLRKPDEELLRVGARAMEVDFAFRVGADELRVVRSYSQSASGKTSKPGLELQVRDGGDWRPLTAESVKATQAAIDARVGIDYETFINSTFLLQGRSDEFTKKKPTERKEILGKILGLDRYERMAARASARWSRLRERVQTLEAEAERLVAALEPEATWAADLEAVEAHVAETQGALDDAAAAEAAAAERLAALDATAREAEGLTRALADLAARTERIDADVAAMTAKAAEADALIAEAERIEADHTRYEALRARRTALDEKATLHRGIEGQLHALRLDLQKQTADLEAQIARADAEVRRLTDRVQDDERRLADRPRIAASHQAAVQAGEVLVGLEAIRTKRAEAQARVDALDKRLATEKGALEGKRAGVIEEGTRLAAEVATVADLETTALDAAVAEGEAARARLDALREEGVERSATIQTLDRRLETIATEQAALRARRQRILDAQDEACPTCGTPLTEAHRAEVAQSYADDLAALDREAADVRDRREQASAQRDALRADYAKLQAADQAGQAAERERAALRDRIERAAAAKGRLDTLRAEARRLQQQLADEDYASDLRAERTEHVEVLDAHPFDEARYEAVRRDAGLREHWAGELRQLDQAGERLGQTRTEITRKTAALDALRERLASGAHGAVVRAKIDGLTRQAESVGYDPAEHESVGRDLDALADAPHRLSRLLEARRSRADLAERIAARGEERRALRADGEAKRETLEGLEGQLQARAEATAARASAQTQRDAAARTLADAQARRGALRERLDRAARDRQRLTDTRAELREAKRERALYNHLKRAFGRHGIPSLIIEETLPEIEDRANALLDRLGDGRTRVSLETLKDKKSGGGTRETLDIRITDHHGVARAYETFSGGEAFRVNFALRIALSQMLAERAGTRIRTLVIDEGFGTQDKEGLQNLIGAIRAIQDDFDTILVITHLDEIKAAFPVRIEVTKEPVTGSTFEIVGL